MQDYEEIERFLLAEGFDELGAARCTMKKYLSLRERRNEELEVRWKIARWQGWITLQAAPYLSNKPKKPEDLFRLPSEAGRFVEKVEITNEIIEALKSIGAIKEGQNECNR